MTRPRNLRRTAGSEAAFQDEVVGLGRMYGWRVYHTHDSRRSAPGFPDLVLLRPPRLIFAELKTSKGRTTPEQREWLAALNAVDPVEVYLWRPDDLQAIAHVLAGDDVDPAIGQAWARERRDQVVRAVTPLVDPPRGRRE